MRLPPRISLIGPSGGGKTSTGRLLAPRLLYDFVDLDEMIEQKSGASIQQLVRDRGFSFFRIFESEMLYSLAGREHVVIAASMSAPINERNQPFFTKVSYSFFLHVSLRQMLQRMSDTAPLLMGRTRAKMTRAYEEWTAIYSQLGATVKTDDLKQYQVGGELMRRLFELQEA